VCVREGKSSNPVATAFQRDLNTVFFRELNNSYVNQFVSMSDESVIILRSPSYQNL
jgi:hypothetical protein